MDDWRQHAEQDFRPRSGELEMTAKQPRRYFVGGFEAGGDWSVRFAAYDGIK
jgi:hypothetical protein